MTDELHIAYWMEIRARGCCSVQLIDGGIYNVSGIGHFIKEVKLGACGLLSIMGPQSSGKSTLLNSLFGTNFMEMDAFKGRTRDYNHISIITSHASFHNIQHNRLRRQLRQQLFPKRLFFLRYG
ncbi:unnamed protein product [Brassica napus]|uniref:(rape) hypothetical protein n=1 Tax=Brassica napus TaxID=3708 RepID=A0A816Z8Z7_BRANA|nr:unnamed protein product [Brassica napus]